jgi:hypothetical protein
VHLFACERRNVAYFFPVFAQEMEIHVAILVSSAAGGFRRKRQQPGSFLQQVCLFL